MLKKVECVFAVCDTCGTDAENGDGVTMHYPAELEGEAEDDAQNADWTVWNGHHWCEGCGVPPCSTCGHLFGEHNYGDTESACEQEPDCACQAFTVGEGG